MFPSVCNSEVFSSVDGVDWTLELAAAPWEGRHCAGYVVHNDRMWVVGGDINQARYQTDVWSSADGIEWVCECEVVPWCTPEHPRALHVTVALGEYIYVLGGQTLPKMAFVRPEGVLPDGEQVYYADCWRSSDGRHWDQIADHLPWAPRVVHKQSLMRISIEMAAF